MSDRMIFNCTCGREHPKQATLPFVAANVAATAGQQAIVLCTMEAVRLGTEGGTEGIAADGLPKPCDLMQEFVRNGGSVWLCGACTKPRGITEDQLASGAAIVGAARGGRGGRRRRQDGCVRLMLRGGRAVRSPPTAPTQRQDQGGVRRQGNALPVSPAAGADQHVVPVNRPERLPLAGPPW
jgi:predicted peroxiredoxin